MISYKYCHIVIYSLHSIHCGGKIRTPVKQLVKELVNGNGVDAKAVQLELERQYGVDFQAESVNNALEILEGKFVRGKIRTPVKQLAHIPPRIFLIQNKRSSSVIYITIYILILKRMMRKV